MTIETLSDKVLLKIFSYYLDDFPRLWPKLVHICRRSRRIVCASQRALHLRLFCTYGTPVLKALDYWPTLPIVVNFGGSPALNPPGPEDEDNIMATLKQSGRVCSIGLTVSSSLLERFSAISEPFSELEELVLLSQNNAQLTLPSTFRWGPRLGILHLTRVTFPALPQLLYSSRNLVDLQLHEVLNTWHISPATLVNALSGMAQLQSLSLHFPSTSNHIAPLPSGERIILPSLTRLNFRGVNAYLEGLVARIDTPGLRDIEAAFFNKRIFDVSKLSEFIDRIETQKSHRRADILSSESAISISLTQPGALACLRMQVYCEPLSGQVYSMAQICSHFPAFISRVENLHINVMRPSSSRQDGVKAGRWLDLFESFMGVKRFHVAGNFSTNILLALQPSESWRKTVLPALHKLRIREPESRCVPLRKAVVSFTYSRRLSGRFLEVEYERQWIHGHRGTGTTYAQRQDHTLTCFEQDLFLSRPRLRFSPMTSF